MASASSLPSKWCRTCWAPTQLSHWQLETLEWCSWKPCGTQPPNSSFLVALSLLEAIFVATSKFQTQFWDETSYVKLIIKSTKLHNYSPWKSAICCYLPLDFAGYSICRFYLNNSLSWKLKFIMLLWSEKFVCNALHLSSLHLFFQTVWRNQAKESRNHILSISRQFQPANSSAPLSSYHLPLNNL